MLLYRQCGRVVSDVWTGSAGGHFEDFELNNAKACVLREMNEEFIKAVEKHPKLFTGFSDTTINHLMFYKLGLSTYYGPNFICDLGEIADEMLPYTRRAFEGYLEGNESGEIVSSDIWYEEREDFSRAAMGTERKIHKEERGFELLQGNEIF